MRLEVVVFGLIVLCARAVSSSEESDGVRYSNSWAVHVNEDSQDSVNDIATKHGFINRGQIGHLPGYYLFEKQENKQRRKRSLENHTEILLAEPKINWVKQQRVLERSKRNIIADDDHVIREKRDMAVTIQDPYYKDQWYLQNIGQSSGPPGLDINVLPVWARGYSGKGVVVSILDDGVDHTHPDLKRNYDSYASFDLNHFDKDPMPRSKDPLNCHGTRCAGEIAAEANNGICGVGVSFNASIGGIRMLDGAITDTIEGMALSYHSDYIDIYTCCWGPKDDGKRLGKPGTFASKALKMGTEKGRGGKGSIFVWATGNGGLTDDDCNCDGYTTSIYTVSIGAISDHGLSTYYTETCASTIAVTYSGASHREANENKIVTTDLNHKCTKTFKGTSSAAPLASGMLALVLEANANLTWRDVQHIIVETSQKTSPFDEGWKKNGAGKLFNHKFGFGNLDVTRMVEAALKWKTVPQQRVCKDTRHDTPRYIPSSGSLIISDNTSSCTGTASRIRKLEHVQLVISLKHRRRGHLSIVLISPSGTRSQLLKTRRNDNSSKGFKNWVFMTVHFWGEDPKGLWSIIITDNDRDTREHHVIKAKQGDMEDVARVVMDDTEERGFWDSRAINEYDRPKHAPPGNSTKTDHILKNMEDTAGELVKGNKFIELAKRKKNRNKNVLKSKSAQSKHVKKSRRVTKKLHNVHHKKMHNKHKHGKYHKKGVHHFQQKKKKKKTHKHKLAFKRNHEKHLHKHRRKHKSAKHNNIPLRSNERPISNPGEEGGNGDEPASKPLTADGSLEIPKGSPLNTKLALQALATPLIEKIMGFTKSNFLPMKRSHQNLVGEVDIKMRVFGDGNHLKRGDNIKSTNSQSNRGPKDARKEEKMQQEKVDLDGSNKQSANVYEDMLKAISQNQTSEGSSNSKEQSTDIEPPFMGGNIMEKNYNTSYSTHSYGNMSSGSEKEEGIQTSNNTSDNEMADSDDKPMIFYDTDTNRYVPVSKVRASGDTSPEAVFIAREGSGNKESGSEITPITRSNSTINKETVGHQEYSRNTTMEATTIGSLVNGKINCTESLDKIDCFLNKEGSVINNDVGDAAISEDEDNDEYRSKFHDDKKNKTKGPPDDLGSVGVNEITRKSESDAVVSKNPEYGSKHDDGIAAIGKDYNLGRQTTEDVDGKKEQVKSSNQYGRIPARDNGDPVYGKPLANTKHVNMGTGIGFKPTENKTTSTDSNASGRTSHLDSKVLPIGNSTINKETVEQPEYSRNTTMRATPTGSLVNGKVNCTESFDKIDCFLNKEGSVINNDVGDAAISEDEDNDEYRSKFHDDKKNKTKGPPDDLGSVGVNEITGKSESDAVGSKNPEYGSKHDDGIAAIGKDYNLGRQTTEDVDGKKEQVKSSNQYGRIPARDNGDTIYGKPLTNTKHVMPGSDLINTGNGAKPNETIDTGSNSAPNDKEKNIRSQRNGAEENNLKGPVIYSPINEQNVPYENIDWDTEQGKSDFGINKKRKDKGPDDDFGAVAVNVFTGKNGSETANNTTEHGDKVHDDISDGNESGERPTEPVDPLLSESRSEKVGTENNKLKYRKEIDDNQKERVKPEEEPSMNIIQDEIVGENENKDDGENVGNDDEERQFKKKESSASGEDSSGSGNEMSAAGSGDKVIKGEVKTKHYNHGDFMTRMKGNITNGGDDDITGESVESIESHKNISVSELNKMKKIGNLKPLQTLNNEHSQDNGESSSVEEPSHGVKIDPVHNEQGDDHDGLASGMQSMNMGNPYLLAPILEEAPIQLNGTADDEYVPSLDMDLSQIPEEESSLDGDTPNNDQNIDVRTEPQTKMEPMENDLGLSHDDSRDSRDSPNSSLQNQDSNLEKNHDQQQPINFLQRVKQDIKARNIPDLQKLENEVRKEMERSLNSEQNESLLDDNFLMDPIPSLEELQASRLVRRGLQNDNVPVFEESTVNTNKNEPQQKHSGVLESWSLIFYGTY